MFAEKLTLPRRKGATGAKLPRDRRSATLKDHEKRRESPEEDEDRNARTLLVKNLPDRVTHHELIEVFEDAFQIRLVSKDRVSERIAYIDFKSQADAERALEEKQGTEIGGLAVVLDLSEKKAKAMMREMEEGTPGEVRMLKKWENES
ncbi:nucleolin-like isoform X3 [Hippopotamus amphibius kiboko]|uniref:nucleolin-like isoform X3 n=1 Tax=Hippopotamus amphibius kiboko TaxID=575201 RepID=UPI002594A6D6|nr:nucleolin-like isoform X3 [Hippopotamus amphibius kiboko]